MHHIHHSEAFVLGTRPKGEDSKIIILYTQNLGLVYGHAQGIRKISSKLRYVLQDFSHVNVDLVRGKEVWRITTATPIHSHKRATTEREGERIMSRISSLLIRLVPGEEASEEIFRTILRAQTLLEGGKRTTEEYRMIELLSVARILVALGYLSRSNPGLEHTEGEEPALPDALSDIAYQHRLIRDINQALAATQL